MGGGGIHTGPSLNLGILLLIDHTLIKNLVLRQGKGGGTMNDWILKWCVFKDISEVFKEGDI